MLDNGRGRTKFSSAANSRPGRGQVQAQRARSSGRFQRWLWANRQGFMPKRERDRFASSSDESVR